MKLREPPAGVDAHRDAAVGARARRRDRPRDRRGDRGVGRPRGRRPRLAGRRARVHRASEASARPRGRPTTGSRPRSRPRWRSASCSRAAWPPRALDPRGASGPAAKADGRRAAARIRKPGAGPTTSRACLRATWREPSRRGRDHAAPAGGAPEARPPMTPTPGPATGRRAEVAARPGSSRRRHPAARRHTPPPHRPAQDRDDLPPVRAVRRAPRAAGPGRAPCRAGAQLRQRGAGDHRAVVDVHRRRGPPDLPLGAPPARGPARARAPRDHQQRVLRRREAGRDPAHRRCPRPRPHPRGRDGPAAGLDPDVAVGAVRRRRDGGAVQQLARGDADARQPALLAELLGPPPARRAGRALGGGRRAGAGHRRRRRFGTRRRAPRRSSACSASRRARSWPTPTSRTAR